MEPGALRRRRTKRRKECLGAAVCVLRHLGHGRNPGEHLARLNDWRLDDRRPPATRPATPTVWPRSRPTRSRNHRARRRQLARNLRRDRGFEGSDLFCRLHRLDACITKLRANRCQFLGQDVKPPVRRQMPLCLFHRVHRNNARPGLPPIAQVSDELGP